MGSYNRVVSGKELGVVRRLSVWRLVERALEVTYERPTEFVRLGAIARARCVLANPERFGGTAELAELTGLNG